jgi:hypothetical protein
MDKKKEKKETKKSTTEEAPAEVERSRAWPKADNQLQK